MENLVRYKQFFEKGIFMTSSGWLAVMLLAAIGSMVGLLALPFSVVLSGALIAGSVILGFFAMVMHSVATRREKSTNAENLR